jgi:multiple sugar transport system substrate-binding protein
MKFATAAAVLAAATWFGPAKAGTLIFNADTSDPQPRAAFQWVVDAFQKENPNIKVTFNVYDHESYKQQIRNWLTSAPPDVVLWYSGERMRQFVKPGLLADVSSLWDDKARQAFGNSLETVTDNGKQYCVPYSYYQWGIFYRGDLFEKAGAGTLKTWDDLIAACGKLKAAGIEPIDIGAKELWPTAGWFDYIDLRTNGYDFHKQLTEGKVAWTDTRVKAVFGWWKQLVDKKCFVKNFTTLSWQESSSLLYQGKSAMMLIGNFITQGIPPEIEPKMQFAPFPQMKEGVADAEEAPMESINIPANAKNKADAMKLLAFVMRADVQTKINQFEQQIPANQEAKTPDSRFLQAGEALLRSAAHTTQFLDRDTSEDLANVAMRGFEEFMVHPDRIDHILQQIERARERIYGKI